MTTHETHNTRTTQVRGTSGTNNTAIAIGALIVAILVIGYFLMVPASDDNANVVIQPPATVEPATPPAAMSPTMTPPAENTTTPAPDTGASGNASGGTTAPAQPN